MSKPSVTREECEAILAKESWLICNKCGWHGPYAEDHSRSGPTSCPYDPIETAHLEKRLARAHLALLNSSEQTIRANERERIAKIVSRWRHCVHSKYAAEIIDEIVEMISSEPETRSDSSEQTIQAAEKLAECLEKLKLFRTSQYLVTALGYVPAIPCPYYCWQFWKWQKVRCHCGAEFVSRDLGLMPLEYRAHYALNHIDPLESPHA